jgi:hypothetical protein
MISFFVGRMGKALCSYSTILRKERLDFFYIISFRDDNKGSTLISSCDNEIVIFYFLF